MGLGSTLRTDSGYEKTILILFRKVTKFYRVPRHKEAT